MGTKMTTAGRLMLDGRSELRMKDVEIAFGGAPTAATLTVGTGTNGTMAFTSLKGEDIGNATTVTVVDGGTNAASVAVSGYDIVLTVNTDGTNATTAAAAELVLDADTNVAALVSTVDGNTTKALLPATKAALTGGDDKLTLSTGKEFEDVTLVRDVAGSLTLDFTNYDFVDYGGAIVTMAGNTTSSGIANVEVSKTDSDTFNIRMYNYDGTLADVSAASKMYIKFIDDKSV